AAEEFQKTLLTEEGRAVFKDFQASLASYREDQAKVLALASAGKRAEAEALLLGAAKQKVNAVNAALDKLMSLKLKLAKSTADENAARYVAARNTIIIVMSAAALVAILLGVLIARSISTPLQKGLEMMAEMSRGHLGLRLKMARKDEIGELARAMDEFSEDLQVNTVGTLKKIAVGDLSTEVKAKDGQDEISPAMAQATFSLRNMSAEAKRLAQAAVDGRLSTRADATQYQGEYRAIVQGVNDTLDAVIGPLNVAAGYVDRISKGDIPPKITDNYNGDFNEIKNNLNQLIDTVSIILKGIARVAESMKQGSLQDRGNADLFQGEWKSLVQGINATVENLVSPIGVAANYVDRISKGDIPPKITDAYNGDFNVLKNNLNTCVDAVNALVADAGMLSKAAVEGKLATRADATKHQGDFRKIVQGVDDTLDAVIGPLNVAAGYVDRISKGDIPAKITDKYNGDFNEIKNNLNTCIDAVNALVVDANMLSRAAVEGKLATRADAARHQGDFRKIVQGVNDTLDAVIGPINEVQRVMGAMEQGDLTAHISADYQGDLQKLRNAVNNTAVKLAQTVAEIGSNANTLASSSEELTAVSTTMASGAEQMTQ
ncbi:MAG TPA: HAMP domain-containing protein, partial [Holophaga sp.]|nr:HAMP domain-containing protein [Holophaga sp.]